MSTKNRSVILGLVVVVALAAISVVALQLGLDQTVKTQATRGSGIDQLQPNASDPPVYTYQVIEAFPHDCEAFTQGLVYQDGFFYEGTGLNGRSSLRRVEVETGEVLQQQNLDALYFGEGIALWKERIIQLTWQAGRGFVYDKASFEELNQFEYATEGWGLTHDGERLIMSDGTTTLYFRDPDSFDEIGKIEVSEPSGPVVRLNELEFADGWVFANIWQTDRIAVIDPASGQVVAWLDLSGLLDAPSSCGTIDVLNGIAYDEEGDRLFVTGKLWPRLYQIEIALSK